MRARRSHGGNALALAAALACVSVPAGAPGWAQTNPAASQTDAAYAAVATWLFDLYLQRSVQLTVANATRMRPGAADVLQPRLPAMVTILARHRDGFGVAMQRALRNQMPIEMALALQRLTAKPPVTLDDRTRAVLIEVDAEFRRDAQNVIGAITADLGTMVADTLASSTTGSLR